VISDGWAADVMLDWAVRPPGISYVALARSPADTNWRPKSIRSWSTHRPPARISPSRARSR